MNKLLLITAISAVFLTACSVNSGLDNAVDTVTPPVNGDLTQEQIVKKFNLPKEPDPAINNATIEGIDSNENDIRDDWERFIAFEHYKNPTMMNINNLLAQNYSMINKAYKNGDTSKYKSLDTIQGNLIECSYYYNGESGLGAKSFSELTDNTFERFKHNRMRDQAIGREVGFIIHGLTQAQEKEICPKYAK